MISNVAIKPYEKPYDQKKRNSNDKKSDFFCHIKVLRTQISNATAPQ